MPKRNMVRIQVAFNLDDPDQRRMYEHVLQRTNHSAYVKRLIQRDLEGGIFKWSTQADQTDSVAAEEPADFTASEFI